MEDKIKFIEDYLMWVNENKLDPPTFSPEEYSKHLRDIKNSQLLDLIFDIANSETSSSKAIDSILLILKDYK